ncbi:MAG: type II toxin-antitoxin system VapC family toxin [Gammaproteobacteria bacterium]|nr:type II toxin-antitoxin system VapC family toxin [Gammaproteobacteria bacterium]
MIKTEKRKLRADVREIQRAVEASGFTILPVHARHVAAYARLPRHHADPFDRMLIAQAQSEPLRMVTADAALRHYGDVVEVV